MISAKRSSLPRWGSVLVLSLLLVSAGAGVRAQDSQFRRGDSNIDGNFDISDAVFTLRMLFLDEPSPGCDDAADADDDGGLNVTDGIVGMRYLFLDGPPPPAPFETCGSDPTADALTCLAFSECSGPDDELCLTQEVLDGLLGESVGFSFCFPAGIANVPLDPFSIAVCPAEGAAPCGLTGIAGCPIDLTSITASVDIPGRRLIARFEGRVADLPIAVTESIFNTTTTCLTNIHGADVSLPFSFEAVIPILVEAVSPGVEEIVGTGDGTIENVSMAMTVSGGLVCVLFQAGQGTFIGFIVEQLDLLTGTITESVGSSIVGLRLCSDGA